MAKSSYSEYIKSSCKPIIVKYNPKKGQMIYTDTFKRLYIMANNHMKRGPASLVTGKCELKTE